MYSILMANKDEFESKGIQWLLESSISDIKVHCVHTLEGAVTASEELDPAIVLLDMALLEGGDAAPLKKALKIFKPIVITFALEDTFEVAKKAIDIGTSMLLTKPFSPGTIVNKIKQSIREMDSVQKKSETVIGETAENSIGYRDLFLGTGDAQPAKPHIMIAFNCENPEDIPSLLEFIEDYRFSERPKIFPMSDLVICLFSRLDIEWKEECKRFLASWNEAAESPLSIIIHKGEGMAPSSLHVQFKEIKKMCEVAFFVGYERVMEYYEESKWTFLDPFLSPNEQGLWIHWLKHQQLHEIREWMYQEFLTFGSPYPDPGLLRTRLTSILAQIRRFMKSNHINGTEIEREYLSVFDNILYSPLIHRIIERILQFIIHILKLVRDNRGDESNLAIIDKCLVFMQDNYWNQNLDLLILSAHVKRNPSYLSNLFKSKLGQGFREKLNEIRIRESKKLLQESEMPIKEIAHLCGFQNQQYFSKIFRSLEGKPPRKFRSSKESFQDSNMK
ncbi:AraC family transcriptional regulator [Falsibacillus pallidus]|uniref:AraC family two component transcriptional regulator n=1 Tax=Falsibacillus pallidus TaxID=493781 RepID=A0A370GRG0_9BACI|nr:response regulator transcription factor [Falsibacillus pallidus]RDI45989.1 AraC family two component transcriptional regulator [Falsibacillus pallidus]